MMLLDLDLRLLMHLLFCVHLACAIKTHQVCNGSSNAGVESAQSHSLSGEQILVGPKKDIHVIQSSWQKIE